VGVKLQRRGAHLRGQGQFQARGRGSILSASSWPGLSRPFTSWQIERKAWMTGSKPGHDEPVGRFTSRRGFHRSGSVLPPPGRGRAGVGVKLQSEGSFRAWGRGSILSASSWPGLSRPSTSWQIEKKGMDARVKPGHDESVGRLKSRRTSIAAEVRSLPLQGPQGEDKARAIRIHAFKQP
jgi:hypothetical protein